MNLDKEGKKVVESSPLFIIKRKRKYAICEMAYSQVVNIEVSKAFSLTTRCCVSAVIKHKNITY